MAARRGWAEFGGERWKRNRPIVLATILPVLAAIGAFIAVTSMHSSPNLATRPSMALFSACLDANNLDPPGGFSTQFDAEVAAQQAEKLCGSKLPASVRDGNHESPGQVSFDQCMKNLGGNESHGLFGHSRFGGGGSGFRDAYLTCRSLIAGQAPDSGQQAPPTTTAPAEPAA